MPLLPNKVKFFWKSLDTEVQAWLASNPNIIIISTNLTNSSCGWGYSITYNETIQQGSNQFKTDMDRVVDSLEKISNDIEDIKTKLNTSL